MVRRTQLNEVSLFMDPLDSYRLDDYRTLIDPSDNESALISPWNNKLIYHRTSYLSHPKEQHFFFRINEISFRIKSWSLRIIY